MNVDLTMDDKEQEYEELAKVFAALGNPVRLRILKRLSQQSCYCGDVVSLFDLAQSTISHHLKILKGVGLIEGQEFGPWVCYCINKGKLKELKEKFGLAMQ